MDNELLAIVSVAQDKRVYCQEKNCKHTVYRSVHIVRIDGVIKVFGSTCFKKYIQDLLPANKPNPKYSNAGGELLSDDDRELLANNTDDLIRRYEEEYQQLKSDIEKKRLAQKLAEEQEANAILRVRDRAGSQVAASHSTVERNSEQLPYPLLRKPDSAYANTYAIPKVRTVIGLDVPPAELINMDNHQLLKLSEQAIQYVFRYERGQSYTSASELYKRDVQRLLKSLHRERQRLQ